MSIVEQRKISIGISACMYGCRTRYNGKGVDAIKYFGREKENFVFTPVCPEAQSGMGIPRDPISLRGGGGEAVWEETARVKTRGGKDVTLELKDGCVCSMNTLQKAKVDAFIFMEGSPSCGVYRTSLRGRRMGHPPGVFGALLLKERIFLIPAVDLQSPIKKWDWLRRLYAFTWLKSADLKTKAQVYEMWHALKFVCQELDNELARDIGRRLSSMPKYPDEAYIEGIREEILQMLRKPSNPARIKQMLWKSYIYYRKHYKRELEDIKPPEALRSMTAIAEELTLLERAAFGEGFLMGSAPVTFRK